jgi:hypothetical protein
MLRFAGTQPSARKFQKTGIAFDKIENLLEGFDFQAGTTFKLGRS